MSVDFEARVAAGLRSDAQRALLMLVVAGLAALVAIATLRALGDGFDLVRLPASAGWKRAAWGTVATRAAATMAFASLAAWALALAMRAALGVPDRPAEPPSWWWTTRIVAMMIIVPCLGTWGAEVDLAPRGTAHVWSLVFGIVVCLLAGYDVVRVAGNGLRALRARLPLLRVRFARLSDAPEGGGRVHVEGVAEALPDRIDDGWVAIRRPTHADHAALEVTPFHLRDGEHTVLVQADERSMVQLAANRSRILVGERVEVVGSLEPVSGGAYRAGSRAITAGRHPLYVVGTSRALSRRLLVAATVELLAAALLAACFVAFVSVWLAAGAAAGWPWASSRQAGSGALTSDALGSGIMNT